MEENQHHLHIACEACKGNFVVPIFWYIFWNCLEKWKEFYITNFISTERIFWFVDLNRRYFQNHETLCSQKVSYSFVFFWNSTPVLLV